MKYWLTVHWPPHVDARYQFRPRRVWLQQGLALFGAELDKGDRVLVYEARSGPAIIHDPNGEHELIPCGPGRQGIIGIWEADGRIAHDPERAAFTYDDGHTRCWSYSAPLKLISDDGFVSYQDMNRIFGFKVLNEMFGPGNDCSGLRQIEKREHDALVAAFGSGG